MTLPADDRAALPVAGLDRLIDVLGLAATSTDSLAEAMSHRSWCAENPGNESNERLEFLGDSVLGFVVADHVFRAHAGLDEGVLTDIRKAVVNAVCLAEVAAELDLGRHVLLGKGEEQSGGREKPSILSDALEAVIGAVYLDGGIAAAKALVERLLGVRIEAAIDAKGRGQDHKSRLQEVAAARSVAAPQYIYEASGPDHAREFNVTVRLDGRSLGTGFGRSKKQAEQQAARQALAAIEAEEAGSADLHHPEGRDEDRIEAEDTLERQSTEEHGGDPGAGAA